MRNWLTAPPLLFWEICLPALLAGAFAARYPWAGVAGLLLIITAAWPFLRQGGGWKAPAARLAAVGLVFAFGCGLAVQALHRVAATAPPDYVFARAGQPISATIKEITALPAQAPRAVAVAKSGQGQDAAPGAGDAGSAGEDGAGDEDLRLSYRLLLTDITVLATDKAPLKLSGDLLWTWMPGVGEEGGEDAPAPGSEQVSEQTLAQTSAQVPGQTQARTSVQNPAPVLPQTQVQSPAPDPEQPLTPEQAPVPGQALNPAQSPDPASTPSLKHNPAPVLPLPGQTVRAHLRIREMRGFHNPGVSDSADRHVLEGTLFRAYSRDGKDGAVFSGAPAWGQHSRVALYQRFLAALGQARAEEAPGRALLPALLFGDRSYLTEAQTDLFAKASLSHSLALSGLHLGFMAGLGWFFARLLCGLFPGLLRLLPRSKWAVVCGAPLILTYLWLGGLSPSLLRAALMFACWGVFVLLERPHPLLDGLCCAVLLLFLADPLIIFDLRLQLSALCVLAIGLSLPGITSLAQRLAPMPEDRGGGAGRGAFWGRLPVRAWARACVLARGAVILVGISTAIQLVITPLQAAVFNQGTPWFVLNLLWLPLLSAWVFPWAMLGLALCAVPGLLIPASWALELAALPATWLFELLAYMQGAGVLIAPLVVRPHSVTMLGYAVLLAALFLCLRGLDYRRMRPAQRIRSLAPVRALLVIGLLLFGFGVGERYVQEHPAGLRARILDVGQGLSILLEGKDGQRMLIDGGGSALSTFNVGEYVLVPLLTANRPPRLDAVINTHPDADHLRGLLPVLQRFDVGAFWQVRPPRDALEKLLLAEALAVRDVAPRQLDVGQRLALDGEHYLRVLYPPAEKSGGRNELSLAAQVVYAPAGRGLLLITGDLTKSGERAVMRAAKAAGDADALRSDVVQVPHHGSKGSLVREFYEQTAPRAAVAGVGYNNQWGFPAAPVRATLAELGVPLFDTAECGQIILTWDDGAGHFTVDCTRRDHDSLLRLR